MNSVPAVLINLLIFFFNKNKLESKEHETNSADMRSTFCVDVVAVHILKLEPATDYAVSSSFPGFGTLTPTAYTAMLHEPLEEVVWFY